MTSQIALTIQESLDTKGVAVLIDADHQCMTSRGVYKPGTSTVTTKFLGVFAEDKSFEDKFYNLIKL